MVLSDVCRSWCLEEGLYFADQLSPGCRTVQLAVVNFDYFFNSCSWERVWVEISLEFHLAVGEALTLPFPEVQDCWWSFLDRGSSRLS